MGHGYRHQFTGWVRLKAADSMVGLQVGSELQALVYRVGQVEGDGLHCGFTGWVRVVDISLQVGSV